MRIGGAFKVPSMDRCSTFFADSTLDCSIFTDRSELRRTAHFAEAKLMVRI